MTFLGISRIEDTNEEMSSDSSVWREVEFESDVEHKEMTRTYGCDDYLSRWLPNIKQKDEPTQPRKEKIEKRPEKEYPNRLFKSPCHHHEGRTLRENKIQNDPTKKTYFEAIKCSPMKLRQSLANFKRPKLEETLTLEPNIVVNERPLNTTENATNLATSEESMQRSTNKTSTTEKSLIREKTFGKMRATKPKSSLGIVEMQNDEMGQLGSLCFRKSLPQNWYKEQIYTPSNMMGGKLRKLYRGTNRDGVLLTGRHKSNELLVRCESIMIYPKVLINQKEQSEKLVANCKQSERHAVERQSDKYQEVTDLKKNKFASRPKEAWNERTGEVPLTVMSKSSETNYTQLPQLNIKDQMMYTEMNETMQRHNPSPEQSPDTLDETPADESVQNYTAPTDLQTNNTASTKIIIPFGENELRNQTAETSGSKNGHVGGERGSPIKTRCLIKETPTPQKVQGVVSHKTGFPQEEGVEGSKKKAGERNEWEGGALVKSRCLKESSKLNEKLHSTRSDLILDVRESGMARKLVITTQYQILNTPSSPVKKFQIPTAVDKRELFAGRENYPPKNKTSSFRLPYNQKGLSEYNKSFDGVHDNAGQSLKIGGKGLLNVRPSRLSRNEEKLAEDESKKRVQFLVHNSRYFT